MVVRLGTGATAASAVIFALLLISSFVVFVASQERGRLYSQSDSADSLADRATAMMGAGGTNILLEAQAFLESGALGCPTAVGSADAVIGRLTDHQRSAGLAVDVSADPLDGGARDDNLSMLAPFDGSVPGELDVSLHMAAAGEDPAAGVALIRSESHSAHLPIRLASLAADCVAAVGAISESMSAAPGPNCTYEAVAPLMAGASRGPASDASVDGFGFALAFSVDSRSGCSVDFQVTLQQAGVQGPGGGFSVVVQEGGTATFGRPASPPPG